MKVDITDFDLTHLDDMEINKAPQGTCSGNWDDLIGVTILLNNEPAAIMGICPIHQGVYDVVMVPGELFFKYPKTCISHVKIWLEALREQMQFHRLQATAAMSDPKYARFLQHLGFKEEGILRKYSLDGQDVVMLAITKEN